MKKIYILSLLMLLMQVAIGQIKFEYDASGNRVKRTLNTTTTYNLAISNQNGLSNVIAAGGSNIGSFIVVSTNVTWSIGGLPSWASLSTSSGGNGTTTVNISFTANNTTSSRSATLTITGNNGVASQNVSISQQGTPNTNCPSDEVVVGNQGGGEVVIKHFDNYYILCTKSVSGSVTRYVPRGKNYWTWNGFTKNANVDQYYTCINVNDSDWWGLANPLPSNFVPIGWLSDTFIDPDGNPVFYFYKNTASNLSLSQSTWTPSSSIGTLSVSITSNTSWTVSISSAASSWLSVNTSSGSNNGTLTLTALANTTSSSRTGTITVTGGGITQTVTVTQAGAIGGSNVVINGNCYTIQNKTSSKYLQVMSDGKIQQQTSNNLTSHVWKAVASGSSYQFISQSNQQYLRVQDYNEGTPVTSGTGTNNLWTLVANNTSYRVSTPTGVTWDMQDYGLGLFLQLYGTTAENFADHRLWTFTQATCNTPSSLTLSQSTWSPSSSSNTLIVSVSSNTSWTVSVSSAASSWLSVNTSSGSNNGTLTLTALANTTSSSRTGTITVTGGGITQTVTVTQAGAVGGGNVVSNGNCYTIQSKVSSKYLQLTDGGKVQQQTANNLSSHIWKAELVSGSSFRFLSLSNQQYLKVDDYNNTTKVISGSGGVNNIWNLTSNSNSYRISSPTGVTWDMEGAGGGTYLQLYGTTTDGIEDFRLWTFTQVTCLSSGRQSVVDIQTESLESNISRVYPNPNEGQFSLEFYESSRRNVSINVYDIKGNSILNENVEALIGKNSVTFDISMYPPAVYLVSISSPFKTETLKIIKR